MLDDGFQHRRLHRDIDIVLIDATRPFGFDHLLPRGLLREPITNLNRATIIGLTRADQIARSEKETLINQIKNTAPYAILVQSQTMPHGWIDFQKHTLPIEHLSNVPVVGFCGIGNPAAFQKSLERYCGQLTDFLNFPDHCDYSETYIRSLIESARNHRVDHLVCTHKDLVKLDRNMFAGLEVFAMSIRSELANQSESFWSQIETLLS